MSYQIGDWVVFPSFGVGRVAALVSKALGDAESQLYYEVNGAAGTVWVQAHRDAEGGLRPLTPKGDLARYRQVLRGQPASLTNDFRQRRLAVRDQLRLGTLQALCELVRDLSGRSWGKPLSENDSNALRTSSEALCREWAAADEVSVAHATSEVNALLLEGRQAHNA